MDIRFAHSLFQALRGDRLAFGYSGAFHDEHTSRLIMLGEAALEGYEAKGNTRGKLAFIMVEAYQNILRHRAPLPPGVEQGEGRSLFLLRCQENGQQVAAVNAIKKKDVPGIHELMQRLNGLDRGELKELFLTGLQRVTDGQRRGAGLGLIEMARRSGSDLGYLFRGLGNEHELFVLAVRLGVVMPFEQLVRYTGILHGSVVMNDIILFHIGAETPGVHGSLLRLMDNDADEPEDKREKRGRAYLAAVDAVRTVDAKAKGVCIVANAGDRAVIVTGTVMNEDAAVRLGKQVEQVISWDEYTLRRHYREALLKRADDPSTLGLLELMRTSSEPITFTHLPVDGGRLGLVRAVI